MKNEDGNQCKASLAHLNDGMATMHPDPNDGSVEDERVYSGKDDVANTIAIEIIRPPIMAAWIEESRHFD